MIGKGFSEKKQTCVLFPLRKSITKATFIITMSKRPKIKHLYWITSKLVAAFQLSQKIVTDKEKATAAVKNNR